MLSRPQVLTVISFSLLFLLLYFGCDTKSPEHKVLEKSRAQKFELISINRIVAEAKKELTAAGRAEIEKYELKLKNVEIDSQKVSYHKALASLWYAENQPLVSGHYAEQIAEQVNDSDSWNIAGTTYSIAVQQLKEGNERDHAIAKSRVALEKALSLSPENVDSKINLALSYVEAPLEDNPMKGILMLVELNQKNPENVAVLMQLARLSLKTGQLEKAVVRLTKVIELRPTFKEAHCMLAEVLRQRAASGDGELAKKAQLVCDNN